MKIVVLYHPNSDHAGKVLDYAAEYKRFKNKELQLLSLETVEGANLAELYDITRYPAILALKDDNQLEHLWQGDLLPLMNDLNYYLQQ